MAFAWWAGWTSAGQAVLACLAVYTTVVVLTRLYGLRAFAKIASYDFAATVAVGSMLAGTATGSVPVVDGLVALGTLYAAQRLVSIARVHGQLRVVDNAPVLLMVGADVLHDNLAAANVTLTDLRSKLREQGVVDPSTIQAVVLETTGIISVLASKGFDLDPQMLDGVRGVEEVSEDRRREVRWAVP